MRVDDGILVIHPEEPLEAADFEALAQRVDTDLAQHGKLRGVLVTAKSFPGWKDFGALLAHLKFVKDRHKLIEIVVVVADGAVAHTMPNIASHFIQAQIERFSLADQNRAWDWLKRPMSVPV